MARTSKRLVSILVLLDFVLKDNKWNERLGEFYAFQSLFYWILFLRKWSSWWSYNGHDVSILVLLDFVLKAGSGLTVRPAIISFNPCFIGFCS